MNDQYFDDYSFRNGIADSQGRVISTQLSSNGAAPVTIAANSYDRQGRLALTVSHGGMRRTNNYDLHGWLTKWYCGFIEQQLLYADGATPSYSGRISSKITTSYGHHDRYDYTYDMLGRLTAASFSRRIPDGVTPDKGSADADFSTAYSYDLQGNIVSLTRQGLLAPGVYGEIDRITATFSGNRLASLRDDAPTVLLESSLDLPEGAWAGTDFAYDANGNQTRDMSRGVTDVSYNALNLPRRVEFDGGGHIEYLYSATGTKLAERVYDADGMLIARRDYVGQFEFVADTLERTLLPEGFITEADGTFHAFIPDHQGNITGVYNSATNALEQFTDYYPYGLPHASATSPETSRRKYGAKELTTDLGLNLYDFAARFQNPAFPHFTTPDPLAEKYYPFSPYLYCGGDPINFIDPTGKLVIFEKDASEEFKSQYRQAKDFLKGTDAGNHLDYLEENQGFVVTIVDNTGKNSTYFQSNIIYWDPTMAVITSNVYLLSPAELLGHEADHAHRYNTDREGMNKDGEPIEGCPYNTNEEKRVIEGSETKTAQQLGRLPEDSQTRSDHGGTRYVVPTVTATDDDCPGAVKHQNM